MEDELVLLQNRLKHLNRAVASGAIARDDENVERNSITRALLDLVIALETGETEYYAETPRDWLNETETPPTTPTRAERRQGTRTGLLTQPRILILAGSVLLALILAWVIGPWNGTASSSSTAAAVLPDLTVRLVFRPESLKIKQTGLAKVAVGASVSEALPIPSDGVLRFRNIPAPGPANPVRLELSDMKYACRVAGQNSLAAGGESALVFNVDLELQTYSGRVIHRDGAPAAGVEIEVDNGLTRAVSDAGGNYSVTLPKWDTENIRLVLRRQGKVLVDRKAGLDATVLKELKIPD